MYEKAVVVSLKRTPLPAPQDAWRRERRKSVLSGFHGPEEKKGEKRDGKSPPSSKGKKSSLYPGILLCPLLKSIEGRRECPGGNWLRVILHFQ